MKIHWSPIPGVCVIEPHRFVDERGFFSELYNYRDFARCGLDVEFVQDNHSRSHPGVLRGLHYQHAPPQTKLVSVSSGRIWDVVVDIRRGSPTCGQWFAAELNAENGHSMWIPAGCAHGFIVLGNQPADMQYKSSCHYRPSGEGGIAHDDRDLGITWPNPTPVISKRDRNLPSFAEYMAAPKFDVPRKSANAQQRTEQPSSA